MRKAVLAFDLGTGGLKSSLVLESGEVLHSEFRAYETEYPEDGMHEQSPEDWWVALKASVKGLMSSPKASGCEVVAVSTSGHSLGVVPIDENGKLLRNAVPIWSDRRAESVAEEVFKNENEDEWYAVTGNGFPKGLYSAFKMLWFKKHEPDLYDRTSVFLGTKDFINLRLCGVACTDYSDASGSGVFSLEDWKYDLDRAERFGLDTDKLPKIVSSDSVLGVLSPEVATELGLGSDVKVICGGVDNSCMALGARGIKSGRVYTSLGSSAWVALTSDKPVIDLEYKPYVFAHVLKGYYNSATCIFSAGTSLNWVKNLFFDDDSCVDPYREMTESAKKSTLGANGVIFNPSLAGASNLEKGAEVFGSFTGLKLKHKRSDIFRATFEGIALNLKIALDVLEQCGEDMPEMLIVGGGAKNKFWMDIFAQAYAKEVILSKINQEATSLGAAALAFVACGIWNGYDKIDEICSVDSRLVPDQELSEAYGRVLERFKEQQVEA
ncbi:pentose kinase [Fulvitalea axinellae]|uniref:Pentose kinase n=2 Tax=Fulvitalea axinellae TaxID=1182444 RepID=A0AAU9CQ67_9BACT|nr:pentose kinase [Fulvitalea axinellae]